MGLMEWLAPRPYCLAPMAGLTHSSFRLLAKSYGCPLVFTEMISAEGLIRKEKNSLKLLKFSAAEHPIGVQLFGNHAASLARAAEMAVEAGADLIDLNLGCPQKTILKQGSGAALMNDLVRLEEILKALRRAVPLPLTLKMRTGRKAPEKTYLLVGKLAGDCGLDGVTLHPRYVTQGFNGVADWSHVAELKANLGIPVLGNGDIDTLALAQERMAQTGCDGVMIGREALVRPWIFIKDGQDPDRPKEAWERYLKILLENEEGGEPDCLKKLKIETMWLTKGFPGSASFRSRLNPVRHFQELTDTSRRFWEDRGAGSPDETPIQRS